MARLGNARIWRRVALVFGAALPWVVGCGGSVTESPTAPDGGAGGAGGAVQSAGSVGVAGEYAAQSAGNGGVAGIAPLELGGTGGASTPADPGMPQTCDALFQAALRALPPAQTCDPANGATDCPGREWDACSACQLAVRAHSTPETKAYQDAVDTYRVRCSRNGERSPLCPAPTPCSGEPVNACVTVPGSALGVCKILSL